MGPIEAEGQKLNCSNLQAAPVVCQYMCHADGKSVGSFAQEGDGTCLGFIVLDGEMDRA
jgi:hypothetical protein